MIRLSGSEQRGEALVSGGQPKVFDPGHGRPIKQWIETEPDSMLD